MVWLSGDQDLATAGHIERKLVEAIGADERDVVVDLDHVGFMDASTVGVLVRGRRFLATHGRLLTVRSPQSSPARVLEICGLTDLIDPNLPGWAAPIALGSWIQVPCAPPASELPPVDALPDDVLASRRPSTFPLASGRQTHRTASRVPADVGPVEREWQ